MMSNLVSTLLPGSSLKMCFHSQHAPEPECSLTLCKSSVFFQIQIVTALARPTEECEILEWRLDVWFKGAVKMTLNKMKCL